MPLAKRLLIIGGALILLSAVLTIGLPYVSFQMVPNVAEPQELLLAVEVVVRLISAIVPPLGSAFVGGGLVMLYLERSGRLTDEIARTSRWPARARTKSAKR